jgi:cell division protein FtsB
MRILAVILAVCIVSLQWPLWVGKGSWLKVWQIESQVTAQKTQNAKLTSRNDALDAEVRDLKTGTDAIEERARNELGMIRQDEVFYQILDNRNPTSPISTSAAPVVSPTPTATATPAAQPSAPAAPASQTTPAGH